MASPHASDYPVRVVWHTRTSAYLPRPFAKGYTYTALLGITTQFKSPLCRFGAIPLPSTYRYHTTTAPPPSGPHTGPNIFRNFIRGLFCLYYGGGWKNTREKENF